MESEVWDMVEVEVCDSIMGSGKSTYIINTLAKSVSGPTIIIVEQRSEVDRYLEGLEGYKTPESIEGGNLTDNFKELLADQENIVTTHSLFENWGNEIGSDIDFWGYSLIMDEVCSNIFERINIGAEDIQKLMDSGCVAINNGSKPETVKRGGVKLPNRYKDLNKAFKTRDIYTLQGNEGEIHTLLSAPMLKLINRFEKITVFTYLFEGSLLCAYLKLHNIPYSKFSVKDGVMCDYSDDSGAGVAGLITIHDKQLNFVGERECSKLWMGKKSNQSKVMKAVRSFMRHSRVDRKYFAWSCHKDYRDDISHPEFHDKKLQTRIERGDDVPRNGQTFLAQNIRGVNHFSHKTHMAYTSNVYINPMVKQFLGAYGIDFDEDKYALSQLIQWIWRGCIRNGDPLTVFVPPKRMRELLKEWLGVGGQESDLESA
tara:strand:- start:2194 stop:3477 length:1284 start_codon:yes stop_codon:yes gene_type:complete